MARSWYFRLLKQTKKDLFMFIVQAQAIVDELFPHGLSDPVDSSLDRLVIGLSQVLTFPWAPIS